MFISLVGQCTENTTYRELGIGNELPSRSAVDIVLIVDDSASMAAEQGWIPSAVNALERAFRNSNIGRRAKLRNKYYVVLFGNTEGPNFRNNRTSIVTVNGRAQMESGEVEEAMAKFGKNGNAEDGYQAIELALSIEELRRRDDVALNLALVTDEPRDPFGNTGPGTVSSLNDIRDELLKRKATVNVLGKFNFESNFMNNEKIVAVDSQGRIHSLDGETIETDGFQNSSISVSVTAQRAFDLEESCRAFVQYAPLAMSTGGAVWDLGIIKDTESNSKDRTAFTNALARIKVEEVVLQSICAECKGTCEGPERKPAEKCSQEIDQTYCRCRMSGKSDEECRGQINDDEANDLQSPQTAQHVFSSLYSTCADPDDGGGFPANYEGWCDPNWPFGKKFDGKICGLTNSPDSFVYHSP